MGMVSMGEKSPAWAPDGEQDNFQCPRRLVGLLEDRCWPWNRVDHCSSEGPPGETTPWAQPRDFGPCLWEPGCAQE